jgi:3-oxoacyl-[acyl-carrier-protein] synthase II
MPFVTGVGWISAQGVGHGRKQTRFQMMPGELPPISRKAFFETPYPRFGRMDPLSRLGVSAIGLALEDAGLKRWTVKRDMGIVVSTLGGCLETDLDYYETVMPEDGAFASPGLFSYTLPNCFLGEAAARFGLKGPAYVVSGQDEGCLSSVLAVLEEMACTGLDTAVAGNCDLNAPPQFPIPVNITPGAAFLVLQKTVNSGQKPYGTVHLNQAREILFNDISVRDFKTLVETALKELRE